MYADAIATGHSEKHHHVRPQLRAVPKAAGAESLANLPAELATLIDDRLDLFDVLREIRENGSTQLDHEQLRVAAIALTGSDDIDSVPVHLTPAQSPDYDLTK